MDNWETLLLNYLIKHMNTCLRDVW